MSSSVSSEASREMSPDPRKMRSLSPFVEKKEGKQIFKKKEYVSFISKLDIFNLIGYRSNISNMTSNLSPTIKKEVKNKVNLALFFQILIYIFLFYVVFAISIKVKK